MRSKCLSIVLLLSLSITSVLAQDIRDPLTDSKYRHLQPEVVYERVVYQDDLLRLKLQIIELLEEDIVWRLWRSVRIQNSEQWSDFQPIGMFRSTNGDDEPGQLIVRRWVPFYFDWFPFPSGENHFEIPDFSNNCWQDPTYFLKCFTLIDHKPEPTGYFLLLETIPLPEGFYGFHFNLLAPEDSFRELLSWLAKNAYWSPYTTPIMQDSLVSLFTGFGLPDNQRNDRSLLLPGRERLHVSIVSQEEVQMLYGQVCKLPDLWKYERDEGCASRAYKIRGHLKRKGLKVPKALVIGPRRGYYLQVPSQEKPGTIKKWDWHIAPLLAVVGEGGLYLVPLDPRMSEEPINFDKWYADLTKATGKQPSFRFTEDYQPSQFYFHGTTIF